MKNITLLTLHWLWTVAGTDRKQAEFMGEPRVLHCGHDKPTPGCTHHEDSSSSSHSSSCSQSRGNNLNFSGGVSAGGVSANANLGSTRIAGKTNISKKSVRKTRNFVIFGLGLLQLLCCCCCCCFILVLLGLCLVSLTGGGLGLGVLMGKKSGAKKNSARPPSSGDNQEQAVYTESSDDYILVPVAALSGP